MMRTLAIVLFGWFVAAPAAAQVGPVPQALVAKAQEARGRAQEAANARLERLQALTFDRRPSAILAAWSALELDEPSGDGEGDADPEALRRGRALRQELALFQRRVTLGLWDEVERYLDGLPGEQGARAWRQMVRSLVAGPPRRPTPFVAWAESNRFGPEDVTGIVRAAPRALRREDLRNLAEILRTCLAGGSLLEECVAAFHAALDAETLGISANEVARILVEAGRPIEAGEFLPPLEDAEAQDDRDALNLLAIHYLAMDAREKKGGWLERAWGALQAVLAKGDVEKEEKEEALRRAVEIAPRVRDELGQAWLDESFTSRPQRGMEILAVIGGSVSNGLAEQGLASDVRRKGLQLQTTAANALVHAAPELAAEWSETLTLLAANWLREAEHTYEFDRSTQRGPYLQRDYYGNFFYYNYQNQRGGMPTAITTADMLDMQPSAAWLERVDAALAPKIEMVVAQLLLKINVEAEAFPFIERLAETHPERARELVAEFLRVWATNHDPNSENKRTSSYSYMFGFEQRANAIPLTRSKQERNLVELAEWIERIRELPFDVDQTLVANAFTAAHSAAEVYRVETIERVFGPLGELEGETLAAMIEKMRINLAGVWRDPALQEKNATRRKQKDIESEVLRGYEVARATVDGGLADHPGDWRLTLARAAILHDENDFRQEVRKSSEYAARRLEAFDEFATAAERYRAAVDAMDEAEETATVYETWFYATLGACDLGAISHERQFAQAQVPLIRAALQALPGEAAERHVAKFANSLFTRMGGLNPAVKFRYVRAGLDIVGDAERIREARDVFQYYNDLVTEIRLDARIDGDTRVGHGEPFGMFVDLRHTREIEREAGGFAKYLVNQNNQAFSYNYGRPLQDYRDAFEEAARETLEEHFIVHSVTFNHPGTHSRALPEYGWRVTPYAYLLLQPRGPEIDKVPSLRMDLDFLDTTGYVVLPVESSPIAIDAQPEEPGSRPFRDLAITQTLDERQVRDGRLVVEIQAQALGLVPDLDALLDLAPADFEVTETDDQGVAVVEFAEDADETAVKTSRTWLVSMRARPDLAEHPKTFRFASARVEEASMEYQRFVDADLVSVEPLVSFDESWGTPERPPYLAWGALLCGGAALFGLGVWLFARSRRRSAPTARFRMPDNVSAFTVMGLLKSLESADAIAASERDRLRDDIELLEARYFQDESGDTPDLHRLAALWLGRAKNDAVQRNGHSAAR